MNGENDLASRVARRIREVNEGVPGSIGQLLHFEVVGSDPVAKEVRMTCDTAPWMRNFAGTLHGGMCATIVDQAMGFVSNCMKPGEGIVPTVQMSVNYQRPLIPGEKVLVKVWIQSVTRSLMHLSSQASLLSAPEKICITATGVYFYKPTQE